MKTKLTAITIALMVCTGANVYAGDYDPTPTPCTTCGTTINSDPSASSTSGVTMGPIAPVNTSGSTATVGNINPTLTSNPTATGGNATGTGTATANPVNTLNGGNSSAVANPTATGTATANPIQNMTASPTATGGSVGDTTALGGNATLTGGNQTLTGGNSNAVGTGTATIGDVNVNPTSTSGANATNTANLNGTVTGTNTNNLTANPTSTSGATSGSTSGANANLTLQKGAVEGGAGGAGGAGGSATIEKGAVQNTLTGGTARIEDGAVRNTNLSNSSSNAAATGGTVKDSGNSASSSTSGASVNNSGSGNSRSESGASVENAGNIATGAVQVHFEAPKPVRAIATTPNAMMVNPTAPTSNYAIGQPNAVGAAGFVAVYEDFCITQMSGDDNVVRVKTDHESIIATLDDQARKPNGQTPTIRTVPLQRVERGSGSCYCLGTIQVEAQVDPDLARDGNFQTIHAAVGKWARENLRGYRLIQLVYSNDHSKTAQKGTAAYASSKGIGAALSSVFGGADKAVAMATPAWGSSRGYTTDYPIVGFTYVIIGSMDDTPAAAQTWQTLPPQTQKSLPTDTRRKSSSSSNR